MAGAGALLRQVAQACKTLPRRVVEDATKQFRKGLEKKLTADTGGDSRLSGAPTRMRVQVKVTGETIVTGTVTPNKPAMAQWVWLDKGTGNPGPTEAKRTWSEPVSADMKAVTKTVRDRLNEVME